MWAGSFLPFFLNTKKDASVWHVGGPASLPQGYGRVTLKTSPHSSHVVPPYPPNHFRIQYFHFIFLKATSLCDAC